jgi:acyl-CoA reductase-like NAD-dependent aldehyde dehydrogenase
VPIVIAAGNTVILKISEKDPSAALWIARALHEAGPPDGAFIVLQGDNLAVDGVTLLFGQRVRLIAARPAESRAGTSDAA